MVCRIGALAAGMVALLAAVPGVQAATLRRELGAAVDGYICGDVLELACGPGTWTTMLADRAQTLTAVDGSPEMLAEAAGRPHGEHVRFVHADLFEWHPERRYDSV